MSSRLIRLNDHHGKKRARLGTSRPHTTAQDRKLLIQDQTEPTSVPKAKLSGSYGRRIDTLIRRCEQASYVVMACVMLLYMLDDGYIFYGLGGYTSP